MEEQRTEPVTDSSSGIWVFVRTSTRAFFGRIKGHKELNDKLRGNIYGVIKNRTELPFDMILEHFSPIRPVPILKDGNLQRDPNDPTKPLTGIGRESITINFEFLLEPCETAIWGIETLIFLEDMGKRDKKIAKETIDVALDNIATRRAAESGVLIPTPDDLRRVSRLPDDGNGRPHFKLDLR